MTGKVNTDQNKKIDGVVEGRTENERERSEK